MTIINTRAAEVTREKLGRLEQTIEAERNDPTGSPHAKELTIRSLTQLANQLREELAIFELRAGQPVASSP